MLKVRPAVGEVIVMVAVATVHVGCVASSVGAAGGVAATSVVFAAVDTHVLSVVLLTVTLCGPAATVLNVADAW